MKIVCIISLVVLAAVTTAYGAPYNYNGYQRPGYDYQPGIDAYDLQRLGGIYGLVTYGLPSNVKQLHQPRPYLRGPYGDGGYRGAGVYVNRYPQTGYRGAGVNVNRYPQTGYQGDYH